MSSDLLSVADAAVQLQISEQQVRTHLRNGKLRGDRVGKSWVIPFDSVSEFQRPSARPVTRDHTRSLTRRSNIVALSFFSGALGLDLGLEAAGIDVLLASEIDPATRETIAANRPGMALIGDIRDYDAGGIRQAAGLKASEEIHLIAGGPPCQAFSTAGRRLGFTDERGNVFLRYIELISELRPRYAVIENVRGLLSAALQHRPLEQRGPEFPPLSEEELPGGALNHVLNLLKRSGYTVSFNLYNAANYGAPQIRERVILICSRDGTRVPYLTPTHSADPKHGLPPWQTFRDAVHGLRVDSVTSVSFPEKRLKYYRMLGPGQNWRNLPKDIQKQAMGKSWFAGGGKTGFYRRLAWDEPAPTVVTHPAMPATDLAHPVEDRPLSIEEYKRLQVFPDDWSVCGCITDQYRQLGNAVPVPLGQAVGLAIVRHMRGESVTAPIGFPYSRYHGTSDADWNVMVKQKIRKPQMRQPLLF